MVEARDGVSASGCSRFHKPQLPSSLKTRPSTHIAHDLDQRANSIAVAKTSHPSVGWSASLPSHSEYFVGVLHASDSAFNTLKGSTEVASSGCSGIALSPFPCSSEDACVTFAPRHPQCAELAKVNPTAAESSTKPIPTLSWQMDVQPCAGGAKHDVLCWRS